MKSEVGSLSACEEVEAVPCQLGVKSKYRIDRCNLRPACGVKFPSGHSTYSSLESTLSILLFSGVNHVRCRDRRIYGTFLSNVACTKGTDLECFSQTSLGSAYKALGSSMK
jgi:hypothetical protein